MTLGLISTLLVGQYVLAQSEPTVEPPMEGAIGYADRQALLSLAEKVGELGAQVESLTTNVSEAITQIGDLKDQMDHQTARINEEIEKQRQILDAISETDSQGYRIPRLSASMQASSGFRDEFRSAVEQSLQQKGHFFIMNRSNETQQISVNRTTYTVAVGETLQLEVPVGNVVTRLASGETRNWTLAAPNYRETIEIIPKPTTTYRPTTQATPLSGYVYPPYVYDSSWGYYALP